MAIFFTKIKFSENFLNSSGFRLKWLFYSGLSRQIKQFDSHFDPKIEVVRWILGATNMPKNHQTRVMSIEDRLVVEPGVGSG